MASKGDPVMLVRYALCPETDRERFIEMIADVSTCVLEEGWIKSFHLLGAEEHPRQMEAIAFWNTDVDWRKAYEEDPLRAWVAESDRLCTSVKRIPSSYLASAAGLLV